MITNEFLDKAYKEGNLPQWDYEKYKEEINNAINELPKEDKNIEKLGTFNIKKFYDDYPETAKFILAIFKKQEELIDKVNGE